MSKTIEERATIYATEYKEVSCDNEYQLAKSVGMKIGYVAGAKEQRAIDFEIAKEHLCADCNKRCVCFGNKESQKNCGRLRSLMTDFVKTPK